MKGSRLPAVLLTLFVLLVAGCGGQDEKASPSGGDSSSTEESGSSSGSSSDDDSTAPSDSGDKPSADPKVDDRGAPGSPTRKGLQTDVFSRVPGSASPGCQAVGDRRDMRSGGFVAGAFAEARASYGKGGRPGFKPRQIRLYWIPEHSRPMNGLALTATSSAGRTVRMTQRNVADAEQWKFYDTKIGLPTGGTWTFRVKSGQDRGCFSARF